MATDILAQRLANQHLTGAPFGTVEEAVHWFGAVQSQDYPSAGWALGLRVADLNAERFNEAFNTGRIVRTHVMRPTWHFLHPSDIRWMLELTGDKVKRAFTVYNDQLDLSEAIFRKSTDIFAKTLQGGKHCTRQELADALAAHGIQAKTMRLGNITAWAEAEGVMCSGPMRGKQHTYALIDEWVPPAKKRSREEALAELTTRYFTSHGPATLKDFRWWSGLSMVEVRQGLDLAKRSLHHEDINGKTYWFAHHLPISQAKHIQAYLLPNYDEYTIGYTERGDFIDGTPVLNLPPGRNNVAFYHAVIMEGKLVGMWRRDIKAKSVEVEAYLFKPPTAVQNTALHAALQRYEAFLGVPVTLHNKNFLPN